jgi:hypothetical protein
VSFYWAEAVALGLPEAATEQVSPWHSCMKGTRHLPSRCSLLEGSIGGEISCTRYAQRPSPCRELQPGDEKCNRARAAHGLSPL